MKIKFREKSNNSKLAGTRARVPARFIILVFSSLLYFHLNILFTLPELYFILAFRNSSRHISITQLQLRYEAENNTHEENMTASKIQMRVQTPKIFTSNIHRKESQQNISVNNFNKRI